MSEELKNTAAIYLEENHISGDTMVYLDHQTEDLPREHQGGAVMLHDLLAGFYRYALQDTFGLTPHADRPEHSDGEVCAKCGQALLPSAICRNGHINDPRPHERSGG